MLYFTLLLFLDLPDVTPTDLEPPDLPETLELWTDVPAAAYTYPNVILLVSISAWLEEGSINSCVLALGRDYALIGCILLILCGL